MPPGTLPTPSSTPAPARKWNWMSGVFSVRSPHQKAPASTMFEALAGSAPFSRSSDESIVPMVSRLLGDPPPSLASIGVPREVETALVAAMSKDPDKALAQCLSMVKDRCLTSRLGKKVTVEVETICLHGDEPTAVNVARHVRKGLEAAGCRIVTIPEMLN